MPAEERPQVVIAGGGVAALEASLALRERLGTDDLKITLVSPTERFDYRPLAVLEPFRGISRWSLALASFVGDQDIDLVHDALEAVAHRARGPSGRYVAIAALRADPAHRRRAAPP